MLEAVPSGSDCSSASAVCGFGLETTESGCQNRADEWTKRATHVSKSINIIQGHGHWASESDSPV